MVEEKQKNISLILKNNLDDLAVAKCKKADKHKAPKVGCYDNNYAFTTRIPTHLWIFYDYI